MIKHISFPKELFEEQIEENFTHFNVSKRHSSKIHTLKKIVIETADYQLSVSDSIQLVELFNYLKVKKNGLTFLCNRWRCGRINI